MIDREWLIADGLGGYAMGTPDGIRTRRYHSLLLVAAPDSERRFVLVNGVEAWLDTSGKSFALSSHRYAPDAVHPDGASAITKFSADPWPSWELSTKAGVVEHAISGVHGRAATVLRWRFGGTQPATLRVRLHLSGRDWHSLHRENPALRFDVEQLRPDQWRFRPYGSVPPIVVHANAAYHHAPLWFRRLQYDEERARGQDFLEDLASPGEFRFELTKTNREACLVLTTSSEWGGVAIEGDVVSGAHALRDAEEQRIAAFPSLPARSADTYIVQRGRRRTIIAGYPWFTDWGRDTFIAVRGLCVATGRFKDAEAILMSWCEHLSDGMMPNLFPSGAGTPEYNSVDASLWFIIAVRDLSTAMSGSGVPDVPLRFIQATEEILSNYSRGTRHNIKMDSDGLLAAGAPGLALTWMDAIVDGRPVTPRIGKPVEVQALWINALEFAGTWNQRWRATAAKARESFSKRFWNEKRHFLYDVVDVDHVAGAVDERLRPNQIFACGGLPSRIIDGERAESVVMHVTAGLLTTMALRTLAPGEAGYVGRADGPLRQRDLAYHQGTAWPWLLCAFMDAMRSGLADHHGNMPSELEGVLDDWSLREDFRPASHEIADGDEPHAPRGCPFQAWTVGEFIRLFSPRLYKVAPELHSH